MIDEEIILLAIREAQVVLAEYIEPGQARECEATINELLSVLDRQDVRDAIDRVEQKLWQRLNN